MLEDMAEEMLEAMQEAHPGWITISMPFRIMRTVIGPRCSRRHSTFYEYHPAFRGYAVWLLDAE
jgi:hypothetical protein